MDVLELEHIARLRLAPGEALLIEAGAGTGKTYTLASLYLNLVLDGLSPRRLAAITFTNAATDELRARLRARLKQALDTLQGRGEARQSPWWPLVAAACEAAGEEEVVARLSAALVDMDEAPVSTIHAFCLRLLARHPGASPQPVALDTEADDRHLEALRDWWRRRVEHHPAAWRALRQMRLERPEAVDACLREARLRRALPLEQTPPDRLEAEIAALETEMAAAEEELRALVAAAKALQAHLASITDKLNGRSCKPADPDWWRDKVHDPAARWCQAPFQHPFPEWLTAPCLLEKGPKKAHREVLRRLLEESGLMPALERGAWWNAQYRTLESLRERYAQALLAEALAESTREAARLRRRSGVVTPDDLLLLALEAVAEAPGLRRRIAAELDYLLVDEFQDTDAVQYALFQRLQEAGVRVIYIGDPKQAIYAFRGADLAVYLQAREAVDPARRHRLGRNFRSRRAVCAAVNHCFDHPRPFAQAGLAHPPIEAAREDVPALELPAALDPAPAAGLTLWPLVPREAHEKNKAEARQRAAMACAAHIQALLAAARRGEARLGAAPVQAAQLAVLVRDHTQGQALRQALAERGIPCAYGGGSSVFHSAVAADLACWLEALAEPQRPALLKQALACPLSGLELPALQRALTADWPLWLERLERLAETWRRHGILAALLGLLQQPGVLDLAERPDGERLLTDYLHLAELLQREAVQLREPVALARWLRRRLAEAGRDEAHQLRLESEADAVRILTIHAAKGLEFPVVYLPFLWEAKPITANARGGPRPLLFHDEAGRWRVDFSGRQALVQADRERLAEELRLLYVALTRAGSKLYGWVAPVGQKAGRGALDWLLARQTQEAGFELPVKEWWPALEDFAARGGEALALAPAPFAIEEGAATAAATPVSLAAPAPLPEVRRDPWCVTSYSGIVRGEHRRVDHDAEEEAPASTPEADPVGREHFPPGAATGNFLHRLLSLMDYQAPDWSALAPLAERLRRRYGLPATPGWQAALRQWLTRILACPLPEGIALKDLASADRLHEVAFHFRVRGARERDLNAALEAHGHPPWRGWAPRGDRLEGLLAGAIDLVYRHQGRYYIADFKSNFLDDYGPSALQRAMLARRYDLQYLLYGLALHRHLRLRLPDYAPERHLGGVRYLFLRGMDVSGGGVHAVSLSPSLIVALDTCFEGGTA